MTYADMLTTSGAATEEQLEELFRSLSPKTSSVKAVPEEELKSEVPPPPSSFPNPAQPSPYPEVALCNTCFLQRRPNIR